MLDHSGCGWTRNFTSGAYVYINLCFGPGHPMEAHVIWADNTTWPKSLGVEAARKIRDSHPQHFPGFEALEDVNTKGRYALPQSKYSLQVHMERERCLARGGGPILGPDGDEACILRNN